MVNTGRQDRVVAQVFQEPWVFLETRGCKAHLETMVLPVPMVYRALPERLERLALKALQEPRGRMAVRAAKVAKKDGDPERLSNRFEGSRRDSCCCFEEELFFSLIRFVVLEMHRSSKK